MLRASGLSVELGGHQVLRNVELTIRGGELVALAGEPGAGKTTFVRCVAGDLAPNPPGSHSRMSMATRSFPAMP